MGAPSTWVQNFAECVPAGGDVLDLAAGGGRHSRLFRALGHPVIAVDRDAEALQALLPDSGLTVIAADLEDGSPWPVGDRRFAGVVVTNYLRRPLLPHIAAAVAPGGMLIYETFAVGNERFGKPSNPAFLLAENELLEAFVSGLTVLAFEHGEVQDPKPAVVQRIAARAPIG